MKHRQRNRGRQGLLASPFVVFTDMTVGLAFFFAVFSVVAALANSHGALVVQRQERQDKVRSQIIEVFAKEFPGSTSRPAISHNNEPYVLIETSSKKPLAELWENGNFQRVKVYATVFADPRAVLLTPDGLRLYKSLGAVVAQNSQMFAYLFVHGIVEPAEVPQGVLGREIAINVSRARADQVFELMQRWGVISSERDSGVIREQIPRKFAIAYGTGADLYTRRNPNNAQWNTGQDIGRVDLVLFYKETQNEDGSFADQ